MEGQEGRLTPTGNGNQKIVSTSEQDGNTHVDQTKGTCSIADVLAQLKSRRREPCIGLKASEGDRREDDVHNDVTRDENAEAPARYVA